MNAPGALDAVRLSALGPWLRVAARMRLTPLNRRRLDNFRRNRRGYWSFWIFLVLFVVSLCAEFVANDRPLVASYKGEMLFPVFVDYPGREVRRLRGDDGLSRSGHLRRDRGARLDDLAADPLRQQHHQARSADAVPLAADLAAERGAMPGGARREARGDPAKPRPAAARAAISSRCGSAPTPTATTSSRGSSTASAFRCCSASFSPASPRSSASSPARCRAISAAGSISSCSASSKSGRRCRISTS